MNKEKMFIAKDENGKEEQYEMLLVKNVDNESIIWYTDGTTDEEGRKNVFISKYERSGNTFQLNPIEDDSVMEKYADIFLNEYKE
ncbi:MAG: DUF1292 domain-containing protein [Bacilli bacterium]|nr:DUF1292 domain-containing protein [Bacilli bacterium]